MELQNVVSIETFKHIANNLAPDELINLLETFIDFYPDIFTNILDLLEPIHLYHLCQTTKKRFNKLCNHYKIQNNIIHKGIKYVDVYDSDMLGIIVNGKLFFMVSYQIYFNDENYERFTPIPIITDISVFSFCFVHEEKCYILDDNGTLYNFDFTYDADDLTINDVIKYLLIIYYL